MKQVLYLILKMMTCLYTVFILEYTLTLRRWRATARYMVHVFRWTYDETSFIFDTEDDDMSLHCLHTWIHTNFKAMTTHRSLFTARRGSPRNWYSNIVYCSLFTVHCKTRVPPELTAALTPIRDDDAAVRKLGVDFIRKMGKKVRAGRVIHLPCSEYACR